ncbi:MAG: hypothetical protein HC904_02405 [Blastochloris sp.]|nr:hypothetical protein [Blastochloris sp.]
MRAEGDSKVWLLGFKTEGSEAPAIYNKGSWVELLGGYFYATDGIPSTPWIINENGKLSASYKLGDPSPPVHIRDIRGTDTREF